MNFSLVLLLFLLLTACGYESDVGLVSEAPAVSTVESPSNGTYGESQNITITVNFNRIVVVSGSPCLTITLDSGDVCASYASGSDSKELTFSYTVQAGDQDSDGIRIGAIDLNGGSIIDKRSRDASLDFNAGDTSQIIVSTSDLAPNIQSVTPVYTTLKTGDTLQFNVEYDRHVLVGFGVPQLTLNLGSGTAYANYASGSLSRTIVFTYTIQPGDFDTDGISVGTSISLNSGSITNLVGNLNADLNFNTINTSAIIVDGLDPVLTSITVPTSKYYKAGEALQFRLNFSTDVNVVSSVRIPLTIGSSTDYATYVSGSGTNQIIFSYNVAGTREDHDGIEIGAIDLNMGSVRDIFGDNAVLTHSTSTPNIKVDTVAPTISSLSVDSGTFMIGDRIKFYAGFSEAIIADENYYISFMVGTTSRQAPYSSGNSSSNLIFEFTVPEEDYDSDGISINLNYSDPDMGIITDLAGNPLASTTWPGPALQASTLVDARAGIDSISVPNNGDYKTNSQLDFTVNYERSVVVTGTPRLTLDVGGNTSYANYVSGSGTTGLVFRYTVATNDVDTDGLILENTIDLNGGDITSNGTRVKLGFSSPVTSGIRIDGITPAISTIESIDGNYKLGDVIDFRISFDNEIAVTGTPRIALQVGANTVYALNTSSPGSETMHFRYIVSSSDLDADGVSITAGSIDLNGGTIKDLFGDNANILISAQSFNLTKVDGIVPSISSVTPPDSGTYTLNQDLNFFIQYNEPVKVIGVPKFVIDIGGHSVDANYVEGSNTNTLKFKYTIPAGKVDTDGISISNSVDLNGGSITDLFLNSQSPLTFTAPNLAGVLVSSSVPTITGITGPPTGTYNYNQTLNFSVTFSETVTVTGIPKLDLDIGGNTTLQATYSSGSGTNTLVFNYQITTAGLSDTEGISAISLRQFSGSTIRNAIGNDADLMMSIEMFNGVLVDTTGPLLLSVVKPAAVVYRAGSSNTTISFTVNFSEPMQIVGTGTPKINLTVGSLARTADYVSGENTSTWTFSYTVTSGDMDLNGISAGTSISLSACTIRNMSGTIVSPFIGTLDLSRVLVVSSTFSHWYDFSDQTNLTLSGGNITAINDKIGNINLSHTPSTGTPYFTTGFNGTNYGYAECSTSGYFSPGISTMSPIAAVVVYRAPPTVVSGVPQLMIGGTSSDNFRIQFYSLNDYKIRAGGAPPYAAPYSTATGWATPSTTIDYLNAWSEDGYRAMGWKWSTTLSFNYKLCQFDGEIAEVILFDSFSPTNADTAELNTYLFNRYGLNLPP